MQRTEGLGVDRAAAGDDQRSLRRRDQRRGALDRAPGGWPAPDRPHPLLEEGVGHLGRLRLESSGSASTTAPVSAGSVSTRIASSSDGTSCSGRVIRSKKRDTGLNASLAGHDPVVRRLDLLQHGVRRARRERVAREQQHRQPVDGRDRGAGDHVRRARTDRGGACPRREAIALARIGGGDVHHRLLVAGRDVAQVALRERLPQAGQVAVPEDAEAAGEERGDLAVTLHLLDREEADEGLRDCQPHVRTPSSSSSVGIASAHASRDATIEPAALAIRTAFSGGQPCSRP